MDQPAGLFVGDRDECLSFCRSRGGHYVYLLRRPDSRPFYVGKGTGDRVFHHENEARHPNDRRSNSHKLNVIRSIWRSGGSVGYQIDSWHDDEAAAYSREAALILALKRLHEGGPLTNRAAGGGSSAGSSPFSKAKHASTLAGTPEHNPERGVLNRFVVSIGQMNSVVIKPIGQFTAKPTQRYPSKSIALRLRTATAIVAAAAAQGVILEDGAIIARRVTVDGVDGLLENGVCCDLLTAGVVDVLPASVPADEQLKLHTGMARKIAGLVGLKKCVELGLFDTRRVRDDQTAPEG